MVHTRNLSQRETGKCRLLKRFIYLKDKLTGSMEETRDLSSGSPPRWLQKIDPTRLSQGSGDSPVLPVGAEVQALEPTDYFPVSLARS